MACLSEDYQCPRRISLSPFRQALKCADLDCRGSRHLGYDSQDLSQVRGQHYLLQVSCLWSWVGERVICRYYVLTDVKVQGRQLSGSYVLHVAIAPEDEYIGASLYHKHAFARITHIYALTVATSSIIHRQRQATSTSTNPTSTREPYQN
jgi:hypothetical protein